MREKERGREGGRERGREGEREGGSVCVVDSLRGELPDVIAS